MTSYYYLLMIAVIILSTRLLGGLSEKVNMPQVVGALIAGVILGPSVLGWVEETDFLAKTAEIGVILLMFIAGLDTDINEIKKNSVSLVVIASMGVILPLIGGGACYYFYFHVDPADFNEMLRAVFMGVILTATSVSITVEALREMGKLNGKVGSAILGAAVLDDIIGIIILTVVTSLKDPSISIISILIKIGLYIILMGVLAVIITASKPTVEEFQDRRRLSIYVMALVLIISFISERYFGIADITGAYLLGLIISTFEVKSDIARKMTVPSYLFFSPIFFASIGIKTELNGMTKSMLIFSFLILVIAVLTKILGCGLGAKLCRYTNRESLNVGIGMISRGEVALIVAQKGYHMGLLSGQLFSPVVLVVIVTTIITPVLLKKFMK
ncbi:cation:proton antiporter [Emergencia sp.]|uniref:cation:proton antiporter n=1 Tax=Emergencia sp. TaxID=1926557 RepID=UPI003AF103B7